MKQLKWTKKFLLVSFLGILFLMLINFVLDPFQQYRKATIYKPIYDKQRYLNPGLVKTYNFTDIIIGSSMTENIILSETTKFLKFEKPIKLSMSGISAHETKIMIDTAINNNPNINNILYGLDYFSFIGKPTRLFNGDNSLPLYLYDSNILNDYKYLLNIDTTKFFLNSRIDLKIKKHQNKFEFDKMYQWQHIFEETDFDKRKMFSLWKDTEFRTENYFKYEELIKNFDYNIDSTIRDNPKINFTIYFTPYSILAYKKIFLENELDIIIAFKKYIVQNLLKYKNVKSYDFLLDKEIIINLDNYSTNIQKVFKLPNLIVYSEPFSLYSFLVFKLPLVVFREARFCSFLLCSILYT